MSVTRTIITLIVTYLLVGILLVLIYNANHPGGKMKQPWIYVVVYPLLIYNGII